MTATVPTKPATRYRCINDIGVHCTRGSGKPKRQKCVWCGSILSVSHGYFGVFEWTGTGRYSLDSAISLHSSETSAERARTGEHVVRFIWTGSA